MSIVPETTNEVFDSSNALMPWNEQPFEEIIDKVILCFVPLAAELVKSFLPFHVPIICLDASAQSIVFSGS